ncbi:LytTR family DNA-binding domain-containing protein [Ekhidna sp.]|uniref:LytR/AlgR family response regulator transcription factor n=2 Tax=Ekhidna sp. TaxID=2608089 RepID=UPI00329980BF
MSVFQDYLQAVRNNGSFYISESLLFNSFWLLFIPGILALKKIYASRVSSRFKLIIGLILSIIAHLVLYAVLIHFLSLLFLTHAYSIHHTLKYGVSTLLISPFVIYGVVLLIIAKQKPSGKLSPHSIRIKIGSEFKKISFSEVHYFQSESPYIRVQTELKSYLHNATLKEMELQLDPKAFIRIHKSAIINLNYMDSYVSRNNGDYDIKMTNGDVLRLSRNYAADFKQSV